MRQQIWTLIRGEFAEIAPESRLQRDAGQQLLLRLIVGQTLGLLAIEAILAVASLLQPGAPALRMLQFLGIIPFLAGTVAFVLVLRKHEILAGYVFLFATGIAITGVLFLRGYYDPFATYYLFIILAGIFILGRVGSLIIAGLSALALIGLALAQGRGWMTPLMPYDAQQDALSGISAVLITFALVSYGSWLASQNLRRAVLDALERAAERQHLNETLERRVKDRTAELEKTTAQLLSRTDELQLTADISRVAALTIDVKRLLTQATRLLAERSGFDHASIYLLDESGQKATLAMDSSPMRGAAFPPGAEIMVGAHNFVGHVLATGQIKSAADLTRDPVYKVPPLPGISSELTLPLRAAGRLIGALDLLSIRPRTFSEHDQSLYAGTADQIAVALENARLFEQQTTMLEENWRSLERQTALAEANRQSAESQAALAAENRRLLDRAQQAVQELNEMNRRLTREGWETAVGQAQEEIIVEDTATGDAGAPTPVLDEAINKGELVSARLDGHSAVAAPITVRGQVIGSIALEEEDGGGEWNEDDLATLRDVAEHVALALENARLFEQTQAALAATRRLAERNAHIAAIGERLYASPDVQTVLQIAASELIEMTGRGRAVVWVPSQKS